MLVKKLYFDFMEEKSVLEYEIKNILCHQKQKKNSLDFNIIYFIIFNSILNARSICIVENNKYYFYYIMAYLVILAEYLTFRAKIFYIAGLT